MTKRTLLILPLLLCAGCLFASCGRATENTAPSANQPVTAEVAQQVDALHALFETANNHPLGSRERLQSFQKFLNQSTPLLKQNPQILPLWLARASIALELNLPPLGWEAGRHLQELNGQNGSDENIRALLAHLQSLGWLGEPASSADLTPVASLKTADRLRVQLLAKRLGQLGQIPPDQQRAHAESLLKDVKKAAIDLPNLTPLWVLQGQLCLLLDKPLEGTIAGQNLAALRAHESVRPEVQTLLRQLQAKGWLAADVNLSQPIAAKNQ